MPTPSWPDWVDELKQAYLAGGSSFFILHGNIDDIIMTPEAAAEAMSLSDFLAQKLFASYDIVLHYDVGRGLRPHPGGDPQRLTEMNGLLRRLVGDPSGFPVEPTPVLRLLDRLITLILVGGATGLPRKAALLFDYGEWIAPPEDRIVERLAIFLNWARNPVIKRINLLFVLMARSLNRLHPALVESGVTTEIRIPMPTLEDRARFVRGRSPRLATEADRLSRLTSGLTLTNLDYLMRLWERQSAPSDAAPREIAGAEAEAPASSPPADLVDEKRVVQIKKQLIEAQCPGLIEFVAPKLDLGLVAGHHAAKKRLADDARLIRQGDLDAVPMGYLICGPVGVGKTFIAMCYAGSVGIPCVKILNFRSKYVGETEANLERILSVLKELGPVAVIFDEADAALGNRSAAGDSGTSARVFAQLAAQMGDTAYRGHIIWFLLTCRPDLLPVDLKRQGRCEEHIPLFYPETRAEAAEMFRAMAGKLRIDLPADQIPELPEPVGLSGADIEGVLTRARREAILAGRGLDRDLLDGVLKRFRSTRGPEHEMQELAAIIECSDLAYLPDRIRGEAGSPEGMAALTRRFRLLRGRIEA